MPCRSKVSWQAVQFWESNYIFRNLLNRIQSPMQTVAFANADGGTILIGVRDDGRMLGINVAVTTFEEWAQ